jgi:hypothetical protein
MALDQRKFRYPGAPLLPTMQEATEALAIAREVVAAVHARLPAATRP